MKSCVEATYEGQQFGLPNNTHPSKLYLYGTWSTDQHHYGNQEKKKKNQNPKFFIHVKGNQLKMDARSVHCVEATYQGQQLGCK